tara:strand:- start:303 stop:3992 length:3690 start_codon:yes stop_codon:yes gene_type:complete
MTLDGSPEERFLGRRGGLPTTKARLQEMARALGLTTDGKTVAQLRSAILIHLGRSTTEQEQQRTQQRTERSRSRRRSVRENLQRSDERRRANELVQEIRRKLTIVGTPENESTDQDGNPVNAVVFDRDETDLSLLLDIMLREFPNKQFRIGDGIKGSTTYYTVNRDNIMRIRELVRRIKAGEQDLEWEEESGKPSDAEVETLYYMAQIIVKVPRFDRRNPNGRSMGSFFKHINLTSFDLTRYGVYQSEEDIEHETNCLHMALKHAGMPEKQLQELGIALRTRDIPEYRLKAVCEKFSCRIRLSKPGRTIIYGKDGDIYDIGLLDEHYFVNEKCSVTAFAIDHYDEVKDLPNCHNFRDRDGKKLRRATQDKHFSKSFHIIEKLLKSPHVRPIEYGDVIMASAFYDKFKQKTGIVLKDIPDSNFEEKKEKNHNKTLCRNLASICDKTPAILTAMKAAKNHDQQIYTQEELTEVARQQRRRDEKQFSADDEATLMDLPDWVFHPLKSLRYYFDFETCPNDKIKNPDFGKRCSKCGKLTQAKDMCKKCQSNTQEYLNDNHSSYGVSVHFDEAEKAWFEGEDHVEQAMRWLERSVKKKTNGFRDIKQYQVLMLAHNLSYDIRFLMDKIGCTGILQKGSKTLTANCFRQFPVDPDCKPEGHPGYVTIPFMLKDTACMIPMPLAKFGKCFALQTEKDVMPYKLYTKANVAKRHCPVEEALQVFRDDEKADQIPQFLENLKKLDLNREGVFDIMAYARFYCEKDTEVLCKGYETFRGWILEALDIDIDNQVTISSVARTYLQQRGCFEGVENIGGITAGFMRQCMVGGRVMTRENKKVHAKGRISDYDAVSLYPSAMARMPGFLKGKPKLLQPDQLNREFLDRQDGYFVHARIAKVGVKRAFPLMTGAKEDGTRTFDNDIEEVYIDKTSLEDLVEFQKCEVEVLDGVYFDQGRNTKISEVMRELFQLRKQKKAEGNPIQEVYKLIMNSGYGFTLMKPVEHDLQLKSRDEADTYIARNYNVIHSITEIGSNKTLVKTHKSILDHFVPLHCGIEVLSWSKRIMNEVMCLAEDIDIPIYYQDTDSMHLPEKDVPKLEAAFMEKYGRKLNGKELGQFHPDFEFDGHSNVRSVEGIFCGKKCYLDVLEGEKDGEVHQTLHVRMKGVPTQTVKWTAARQFKKLTEVNAVRKLYKKMLNGKEVQFDLTQQGTRTCFDSARDFTVKSREKFDRNLTFRNPDVLYF